MTLPDPRDDKWGGPDIRISEYGLWDNEDEDGDPDVPQTDTTIDSYSRERKDKDDDELSSD